MNYMYVHSRPLFLDHFHLDQIDHIGLRRCSIFRSSTLPLSPRPLNLDQFTFSDRILLDSPAFEVPEPYSHPLTTTPVRFPPYPPAQTSEGIGKIVRSSHLHHRRLLGIY